MFVTELTSFGEFKSYCMLKFGKLIGFLIKKDSEIDFLDALHIFELLLQLESNVAEILNVAFIHRGKKSGAFFISKNIVNF